MTEPANLLFFAGSSRRGSFNKKLAQLAAVLAKAEGHRATLVDLADYELPLYNGDYEIENGPPENARRFKTLLEQHSGIMIACPEYNASITPLLKNMLDWISHTRDEDGSMRVFKNRVFLLASASPSGMGGLRGLTAVRHVLEIGLGALVLPEQFAVPRAPTAFEDDGTLKDADAQERLRLAIQKLGHTALALYG